MSGLLSLFVTCWFSPLDTLSASCITPSVFQVRNVVPIGSAAFGFALGLVGKVVARAVVLLWIRPYLRAISRTIVECGRRQRPHRTAQRQRPDTAGLREYRRTCCCGKRRCRTHRLTRPRRPPHPGRLRSDNSDVRIHLHDDDNIIA